MNPLIKKEIRGLAPSAMAVLLLATVLPWILNDADETWAFLPALFFFGILIVAIDSFGREFHSNTFQLLLSQPIARERLWRTKLTILTAATALIWIAFFTSCVLRMHQVVSDPFSIWYKNAKIFGDDFWASMAGSAVVTFVGITGGLWTTLLFRQVATAFWIAFLAPTGLGMLVVICFPSGLSDTTVAITFTIIGLAYSLVGFWLARRLFYRAQDVAWTGGVIAFSRWKYFERNAKESIPVRRRAPLRTLVRKEFALQSIALMGAAILLGLHIVVLILRALYVDSHRNSILAIISDFFWGLWMVLPIVIGCMAMAEERKLGVIDGQLCLPASRPRQFLVKFIPMLAFGIFFGGIVPVLLETGAGLFGDGNEIFTNALHQSRGLAWVVTSVVFTAAGFAMAAFFASSLARNFLQALSITIIIIVASILAGSFVTWVDRDNITFFGITPWRSILPFLVALLVMPLTFVGLAYINFNRFHEMNRMWLRNLCGIIGALALVGGGSALIYNRAWEVFEPAEPAHGAARLSLSNPPRMHKANNGGLTIIMPDGKAWVDYLGYPYNNGLKTLLHLMFRPVPCNYGPARFVAGSDWTQLIALYDKIVGLKSDGTLEVSERPLQRNSTQESDRWVLAQQLTNPIYGSGWQGISASGIKNAPVYLLKTNHTLWRLGIGIPSAHDPQEIRGPYRVGTNEDWTEIYSDGDFLKKADGTVWYIAPAGKKGGVEFFRVASLDEVNFQTSARSTQGADKAYVGKDGRLMVFESHYTETHEPAQYNYLPCGSETNWVAVSVEPSRMIALKADGTLWQWAWKPPFHSIMDTVQMKPRRLGIHNDWVAIISSSWFGTYSTAADGSVWLWPSPDEWIGALVKMQKQPEPIGNVFDPAD